MAAAASGSGESQVVVASRTAGVALEGMLYVPAGARGSPAVVICHPNPLSGGNMENSLVKDVEAAFARARFVTLRFNFRGAGRSSGVSSGGDDEVADCQGALDFVRGLPAVDPGRVGVVGYSFGATVALKAATVDGKVRACACLGFPLRNEGELAGVGYFKRISCPTLFVAGTEDELCRFALLERAISAGGVAAFCSMAPIDGTDHLFGGLGRRGIAVRRVISFVSANTRP